VLLGICLNSIYGLSSKIGNRSYYDSSGQSDYSFSKPYSEKTAEIIDEEVSKLIETCYQRTLKILENNKDKLTLLAEKLLEKEVIFRDDLELIFGKSKFEEELKEEKKVSKKELNTTNATDKGNNSNITNETETLKTKPVEEEENTTKRP